MENEQKTVELTRAMYKEIKAMNRDQMQQVLTNIYDQGANNRELHLSCRVIQLNTIIYIIKGHRW